MKRLSLNAKIIPRIFGGLGNQLFCYAAARRLALVHNVELILDDVSGFVYDHRYQRHYQLDHFHVSCRKATPAERLEPFSRFRRYLKRRWNQRLPFDQRRYLVQEGLDFDPRLLDYKPKGNLYLEGYWQSEGYFKDVEEAIRSDLKIKPPSDAPNLRIAESIHRARSVAVHIRFFELPSGAGINNVSADYYLRAIGMMEKKRPGAHYFIFSDRPEAARAVIPLPNERVTCVSHNRGDANAYADLWLMTLCQDFIIANSTFSWWGAWLSANLEKVVIAPALNIRSGGGRITSWGFKGLIPSDWISQ